MQPDFQSGDPSEPEPSPRDAFQIILEGLVTKVTWQTWLEPLVIDDTEEGVVIVKAPNDFHVRWIRDKHLETIEHAVEASYGQALDIRLESQPPEDVTDLEITYDDDATGEHDLGQLPLFTSEAPKYSFENFVVGPSNRFAWAASMAVCEQPGTHYNPLFIYGPAGLGKTHLLKAVAHQVAVLDARRIIRYVTSEEFFNDFIDGIRRKRMDQFKHTYRTTDVLLLDDVQFFDGKEQILEEFFHTFNSLYDAGKQMVITSDRHPRNSTLPDRLRSRFEWGLLTDIQPPDIETRLAILRTNAAFAPTEIPESVLEFIAGQVSDNIRELEGALTRITAYAALHAETITLDMAQDVLQDLAPRSQPRMLTAEEIIHETASACNVTPAEVIGSSRRRDYVRARQIAMYLSRDLTDLSLPKIGAKFGGRDHTTVMHALDKVKKLMASDKEVFDQVTALSQKLRET